MAFVFMLVVCGFEFRKEGGTYEVRVSTAGPDVVDVLNDVGVPDRGMMRKFGYKYKANRNGVRTWRMARRD
jgi:hypothetical protein